MNTKAIKKLIITALALSIIFTLTACQNGTGSSSAADADVSSPSSTSANPSAIPSKPDPNAPTPPNANSNSDEVHGSTLEINEFFISEGVALSTEMGRLAGDEEYIGIFTVLPELVKSVKKMAAQDYSVPSNVYVINLSNELMNKFMQMALANDGSKISEETMEKLKYKINSSTVANLINSAHGSEILASTSITTNSKSYIMPKNWSDNTMLLLSYDGEFSTIVSFAKSGDGVISAMATFVVNGDESVIAALDKFLQPDDSDYKEYSKADVEVILAKAK